MPPADLPIHDQQLPQIARIDALSVRNDVLLTNDKGQAKASVQKRSETALRKLMPALQSVLLPGETVLYIARANSPLTPLEAVTAAWWTRLLTASAIVFTNQRLLFFPVKRDGSWRESIRAFYWGDLEEVKPQGLLVRNIVFKSKNGTKTTYTNFRRGDAKSYLQGFSSHRIRRNDLGSWLRSALSRMPQRTDRGPLRLPGLWYGFQKRKDHGHAIDSAPRRWVLLHRAPSYCHASGDR